ncbi:MAG: thermonuclease family protein [Microcoleaceae cyanobacterium]
MKIRQSIRQVISQFFQVWTLLALMLVVCLVGCSTPDAPLGNLVQVERVVSGQTLEVINPASTPNLQRVRLIGISAPDLKQDPWGAAARQYLDQLCQGQQVLLEIAEPKPDRFNRVLAYVWLGGVLINEQLVREGYVLVDQRSGRGQYTERLQYAQQEARILERNIWNPEQPLRMTAAEFRQQESQN